MTKKLSSTSVLPAAVEAAFALRTSREWVTRKAETLRDGSALLERAPLEGGGVELLLQRDIPQDVPGMFRRFIPADARVTQRESWTPDGAGGYVGTWSLGFDGAPGSLGGQGELVSDGVGSVLRIHGVAQVSVPMIGGRAEGFLVPLVEGIMRQEGDLLARLLAGGG